MASSAGAFRISRDFDASRELVFKAWSEPERLAEWFGMKGGKIRVAKFELKPGGTFHYGMVTPDGGEMWGKWTFREIVFPERIVLVNSFSDSNAGITRHPMSQSWPLETLSTATFAEVGGKTRLTVEWLPINATAEERRTFDGSHESMKVGWTGTMDQLESYLARKSG